MRMFYLSPRPMPKLELFYVGLSKDPDHPKTRPDPTRTDRYWAGLRTFRSGFGSKFRVIFGFGSGVGSYKYTSLNPIFSFEKNLYSVVVLSASLMASVICVSHPSRFVFGFRFGIVLLCLCVCDSVVVFVCVIV